MNDHRNALIIAFLLAPLWPVVSCNNSSGSGGAPNITPTTTNDGWQVATPAGQGVDEAMLDVACQAAKQLPNRYSLMVVSMAIWIACSALRSESTWRWNFRCWRIRGASSVIPI